jgi:hypothetical protein
MSMLMMRISGERITNPSADDIISNVRFSMIFLGFSWCVPVALVV